MKTILCFGDSNTHGSNPHGGPRFDLHTRWAGVLRDLLGSAFWVIEEGCGGRTTVWDDPIEGPRNGGAYLQPCLHSHMPLDLVIILLGTNDLKHRFGLLPDDIARGARVLVDMCQRSQAGPNGAAPQVLLLAPPPLSPLAGTVFEEMFAGAEEKSRQFGRCFGQVAQQYKCGFLDLAGIVTSSTADGIHWEAPGHTRMAKAVAVKVRQILGA